MLTFLPTVVICPSFFPDLVAANTTLYPKFYCFLVLLLNNCCWWSGNCKLPGNTCILNLNPLFLHHTVCKAKVQYKSLKFWLIMQCNCNMKIKFHNYIKWKKEKVFVPGPIYARSSTMSNSIIWGHWRMDKIYEPRTNLLHSGRYQLTVKRTLSIIVASMHHIYFGFWLFYPGFQELLLEQIEANQTRCLRLPKSFKMSFWSRYKLEGLLAKVL